MIRLLLAWFEKDVTSGIQVSNIKDFHHCTPATNNLFILYHIKVEDVNMCVGVRDETHARQSLEESQLCPTPTPFSGFTVDSNGRLYKAQVYLETALFDPALLSYPLKDPTLKLHVSKTPLANSMLLCI